MYHLSISHAFVLVMMVFVGIFTGLTINMEHAILLKISGGGNDVNISGRQRMYSQRIGLLKAIQDSRSCLSYEDELEEVKNNFLEAHEKIRQLSMSETTRAQFEVVDDNLVEFKAQIELPSTNCSLVKASTTFLDYINDLVGHIETDLRNEVGSLSLTLTLFQCGLFAIVLLIGMCSVWKSVSEKARYTSSMNQMIQYLFHEIRNPLNHVVNGLEHVIQTGPANMTMPEIVEELTRCSTAGVIITTLLDDVLTMATIDSKADIPVYPAKMSTIIQNVADTVSLSSTQTHFNVKVETQVLLHAGSYMTNTVKLSQVLMNLASNAVKYAGVGKTVVVGVSSSSSKNKNKSGDVLHFFVRDNGVGMTKETQKQLFSKFKTFHRDSGTGLGLYIASSIVHRMGGKIKICSPDPTTGCGSVFEFYITMRRCSEIECLMDKSLPSVTTIRPNLTILVADDEQINCRILERKLTSAKVRHLEWKVVQAMTLPGVLEACVSSPIDVILLDEHFGNGQLGSLYISKLRDNGITSPVFIASANCSPADHAIYQSRGAYDTISKPTPCSEILVATIAQAYELNIS